MCFGREGGKAKATAVRSWRKRGAWRGSDALIDEIAIGGWAEIDSYPMKPVEGVAHVASGVPAEHEVVFVALHVALPQTGVRQASCRRHPFSRSAVGRPPKFDS